MNILGLEKLSLVDYEGNVCATVFTGGCNFFCPFCHNASLVACNQPKIETSEVIEYLKKRKGLLDAVTISGGEPTLQPDLDVFIKKIKDLGYKIKLDTNGAKPEVVKNLLDQNLLDYVAMDIKNNFDDYGAISGLKMPPVDKIRETLNILSNSGVDFELRTTLVKEYHKQENIIKMAQDLAGQKLLYLQKFVDSGECNLSGLNEVDKSEALKYQEILKKTIKNVILRGY